MVSGSLMFIVMQNLFVHQLHSKLVSKTYSHTHWRFTCANLSGVDEVTKRQKPQDTDSLAKANKRLAQVAADNNFSIVDVPRDGNCGLHAVAHQLSTQGVFVDAASIRQRAVTFLRSHPLLLDEQFILRRHDKDMESYVNRQSKNGQWVDEMMLRAVGACITRDIHILHDNGHVTKLDLQTENNYADNNNKSDAQLQSSINIGQSGETHYVSLIKNVAGQWFN